MVICIKDLVFILVMSLDIFAASFVYGADKIKIPQRSALAISIVCSLTLFLALFAGSAISGILPGRTGAYVGFSVLFILGILKLFDFLIKSWIKPCKKEFHFLSFHFFLQVVCDSKEADKDKSKNLSIGEACLLALSLNIDEMAAGVGAGFSGSSKILVFALSLLFSYISVYIGEYAGIKLSKKTDLNLSWLGGVILIILAFFKL